MHHDSIKGIVDWKPCYVSVGDVLAIKSKTETQIQFCVIYDITVEILKNNEFDNKYFKDALKYKKSKKKKKQKNIRYSKKKMNRKTIKNVCHLRFLSMIDDNWSVSDELFKIPIDSLCIHKSFQYWNFQNLLKDFPIKNKYYYVNNEYVIDEDTTEIFQHLTNKIKQYTYYNNQRIPVNLAFYADDLSMNVNKKTSYGVARIKFLDGDRHINNKLSNIPIIFVYPKKTDKISLMKVISKLFGKLVTEPFVFKHHKFQCQICAMIMDSQERVLWSNINCTNATINPCSTCNIERDDVLNKYKNENQFEIDDDSDRLSDVNMQYNDSDSDYHVEDDVKDENENPYVWNQKDLCEQIWDDWDLDNFDDIPLYVNHFFCVGNWGFRELNLLKKIKENIDLNKYSFVYPHLNILYWKNIRKMDINRLFVNDIAHSFSNMSKQIISDLHLLCNTNEWDYLESQIIRYSLIVEYDQNKLVQHENIMILEKLTVIIHAFTQKYPNHQLSKYMIYYSYISIYVMIVQYDDPNEYDFVRIAFIVYNFIRHLSDLALKKRKRSFITAVTLHQFTSFTITTLYCYKSLKIYSTSPMERGMSEIRQLLNKSFNKSINQCIINLLLRRDMWRLLTGKFKFKINIDQSIEYKYIWDFKGDLLPSKDLIKIKNRKLYMDSTDIILCTKFQPKKFITINNEYKYYQILKVKDYANIINTTNHYKRLKYYPNNWIIGNYYLLDFDDEYQFLGELKSIYTLDDLKFYGDFILFHDSGDIAKNGYLQFRKSDQILEDVILNTQPHTCTLYKFESLYLLHPVYYHQKRKSISLHKMWNALIYQ